MLNFSQWIRESSESSFFEKWRHYLGPEFYIAESIVDYQKEKNTLAPPWYKKNPFAASSAYAVVIFNSVGIDAIVEGEHPAEEHVLVHDFTGQEVMCWTTKGAVYPMRYSYPEVLKHGELEQKDWVYELFIRHSYDENLAFVALFTKQKFNNPKKEHQPLRERLLEQLLHPLPEPSPG